VDGCFERSTVDATYQRTRILPRVELSHELYYVDESHLINERRRIDFAVWIGRLSNTSVDSILYADSSCFLLVELGGIDTCVS
jgi:hypothetical protein